MIQAVIFDMDGLILDTEPMSKDGWRNALAHYGQEMPDEVFHQMVGRGPDSTASLLRGIYGELDFADLLERRTAHVEAHIEQHGVQVKKGLEELLATLEQLGLKKCIATSTVRRSLEYKKTKIAVLREFEHSVTGDEITRGKPYPDIFLKAAAKLDTAPENCMVLEDSLNGIAAALAAGMRAIMVPDIVPPGQDILDKAAAGEVMICRDLLEVVGVLKSGKIATGYRV